MLRNPDRGLSVAHRIRIRAGRTTRDRVALE
jgi:hypothetical protein